MSALLITALVGLVIPALVALVTKETLQAWAKSLILLLLSTASGILAGVAGNPPHSWTEWKTIIVAILVTFVSAAASQVAVWAPKTGAFAHLRALIDRKTGTIGIGPASPSTGLLAPDSLGDVHPR